ncbi:hypothetical protein NE237_017217 [Protea cynaroides]|uniref:Uncharacterized protein n=1 Tax=Protea cynaroides TaxID=273540 RepID=A0A9Q0QMP7_9MAGN|nr:hypothetical protein NE237_017217 [Protea cynaroides]
MDIKLLATQTIQRETKEAYNAQATAMEKIAVEFTTLHNELLATQDKVKEAKAAGKALSRGGYLEVHQSEPYTQALKDAVSGYFKEGVLYLRSCLDEQGVVAIYSVCLPFTDEAGDLGGVSTEVLEDAVEEDHSPYLPIFEAPPQTPVIEVVGEDFLMYQTIAQV